MQWLWRQRGRVPLGMPTPDVDDVGPGREPVVTQRREIDDLRAGRLQFVENIGEVAVQRSSS